MATYLDRKKLLRLNVYQKPIIFLAVVPALILCSLLTVLTLLLHRELIDVALFRAERISAEVINSWTLAIICVVWLLFLTVILVSIAVSSQMVGALERIIAELDEMVAGKPIKELKARDDDELAKDILTRVNAILKKFQKPDTGDHSRSIGRF